MTNEMTAAAPRWRGPAFIVATVAGLALVVVGLGEILLFGVVGWLDRATLESVIPGGDLHRVHGLGHGLLAWIIGLSVLGQAWRPSSRFALAVLGLVAICVYTAATLVSGIFDGLELVGIAAFVALVWLHPGRESASFSPIRPRALLAASPLVLGAAVLAVVEVGRQLSGASTDVHVAIGHYALMGAMAVVIAVAAVIGSTSLSGARVAGWLAVGGTIFIGLAWIVFPDSASSLGAAGGAAAGVAAAAYGWGLLTDRAARPEPMSVAARQAERT